MRSGSFCLAGTLLAVIFCLPVAAGTIMGAGSLQSWSPSILGTASSPTFGGPYWNSPSGEGGAGNIGWCLLGSSVCPIADHPGPIPFFGDGTSPVANMFFSNSVGSVEVSLLGNFTSQTGGPDGVNYFGWYALQPDGTLGVMHNLWSSAAPVGTSAVFNPVSNYGFFLENVKGLGTPAEADYFWFMNTAFDSTGGTAVDPANHQHFAVFSPGADRFVLGIEDATPGDLDFNDMIVQVSAGVPEPRPALCVGAALLLCVLLLRRGVCR